MPIASVSSKQEIVSHYELIQMLEEKCKCCRMFKGKEPEQTWIYEVSNPIPPRKYTTKVVISKYGKKYAMLTPEDLAEEDLVVFEFVFRDAEPEDEIVVFSKRDYHAAKKYLYDKKNKITFCS